MQSFFSSIIRPVCSSIRRSTRFLTRKRFPHAGVISSEYARPRCLRVLVERQADLAQRSHLDKIARLEAELLTVDPIRPGQLAACPGRRPRRLRDPPDAHARRRRGGTATMPTLPCRSSAVY